MKIKLSQSDLSAIVQAGLLARGFKVTGVTRADDGTDDGIFEGQRTASQSFGKEPYLCQQEWPVQCSVQCGGDGIVLQEGSLQEAMASTDEALKVITCQKKHYKTAFFEAFPRNPNTFIRGEGATIEEAEASCWKQYQGILSCPQHDFDRRDREDGYCYCKHCNLSGMFLLPVKPCTGCGAVDYKQWSTDKHEAPYCETCFKKLPDDLLSDLTLKMRALLAQTKQ